MTVRKYIRTMTDTVLSLLDDVGPMTMAELVPLTGRKPNGVRDSIRRLRDERKVHISAYLEHGMRGRRQPVYAVGDMPDAVEGSNTNRERNVIYRARNRSKIRAKNAVRRGTAPNIWAGLRA